VRGTLLAALLAGGSGPVQALELVPASTQPVLAEPLEIGVTARFETGFELGLDTSTQGTGPFAVVSLERTASEARGEGKAERWTLRVLPLKLGPVEFPALEWRLTGPGERVLKSPPVPLTVVPPASVARNPDILELRLPVFAAGLPWGWILLGAALVVLAAWAAWRRGRRRAAGGGPEGPPLSPEERARRELEALLASGLWEGGGTRAFYERLASILREYLEARHGLPATRLTTHDLGRRLRRAGLDPSRAGAARELLDSCDMVKFAKHRPGSEDRDKDLARLRRAGPPPPPPPAPSSPQPGAAPT